MKVIVNKHPNKDLQLMCKQTIDSFKSLIIPRDIAIACVRIRFEDYILSTDSIDRDTVISLYYMPMWKNIVNLQPKEITCDNEEVIFRYCPLVRPIESDMNGLIKSFIVHDIHEIFNFLTSFNVFGSGIDEDLFFFMEQHFKYNMAMVKDYFLITLDVDYEMLESDVASDDSYLHILLYNVLNGIQWLENNTLYQDYDELLKANIKLMNHIKPMSIDEKIQYLSDRINNIEIMINSNDVLKADTQWNVKELNYRIWAYAGGLTE